MISIEICYSTSKDIDKFLNAEKNAVKLIVQILKERNWGVDRVFKHQDFNGKYCPHKTLDLGWDRFIDMIKEELGESFEKNTNVLEWQKVMNKVYNCNLAEDNSFGPDCKKKALKYYLHYTTPTIKNKHVEFMQKQLRRHGYNVDIDSSFGPDCEAKTKQFQKDHKLTADGYIGADTTQELLK